MINITPVQYPSDIIVFELQGDLKIVSAEESKNLINSSIEESGAKKILLNLQGLTFLDSAGLGVFISAFKLVSLSGGVFGVCCLTGQPKTIFEISNLQKVFDVFQTLEEALKAWG